MSVHVTSWVWRQPIKDDGKFRLLLSFADMADDEGVCQPTTLGQLAVRLGGCSQSTVQRRIRQLTDDGYVAVLAHYDESGARLPNMYRVVMDGEQLALDPLVTDDQDPLVKDPLVTAKVLGSSSSPRPLQEKGSRARDPIFDALVEATHATVSVERGPLNLLRKLVLSQEFDDPAAEIQRRAEMYREVYPEMSLTAAALLKHWSRLPAEHARLATRTDRRGMTGDQMRAVAARLREQGL